MAHQPPALLAEFNINGTWSHIGHVWVCPRQGDRFVNETRDGDIAYLVTKTEYALDMMPGSHSAGMADIGAPTRNWHVRIWLSDEPRDGSE